MGGLHHTASQAAELLRWEKYAQTLSVRLKENIEPADASAAQRKLAGATGRMLDVLSNEVDFLNSRCAAQDTVIQSQRDAKTVLLQRLDGAAQTEGRLRAQLKGMEALLEKRDQLARASSRENQQLLAALDTKDSRIRELEAMLAQKQERIRNLEQLSDRVNTQLEQSQHEYSMLSAAFDSTRALWGERVARLEARAQSAAEAGIPHVKAAIDTLISSHAQRAGALHIELQTLGRELECHRALLTRDA